MSNRRAVLNVKAQPETEWTHNLLPRALNGAVHVPVPVTRRRASPMSSGTAQKRTPANTLRRTRKAAYTGFQHEVREALSSDSSASSSSADESMQHEPLPQQPEITVDDDLAYDAAGENVLLAAISKAETKYENKVTEKLVKEYELVSHEGDAAAMGYVADIDDFEVIDRHCI